VFGVRVCVCMRVHVCVLSYGTAKCESGRAVPGAVSATSSSPVAKVRPCLFSLLLLLLLLLPFSFSFFFPFFF
jgi:hypothetical protein